MTMRLIVLWHGFGQLIQIDIIKAYLNSLKASSMVGQRLNILMFNALGLTGFLTVFLR